MNRRRVACCAAALIAYAIHFSLERGEPALPVDRLRAKLVNIGLELVERADHQLVLAIAAADGVADQPGFAEHAEMPAHRRPAHRERAVELAGRVIAEP